MFFCEECVYFTRDKINFNRYLYIHAKVNVKPFKSCNFCGYQTHENFNFQRHLKSHELRIKTFSEEIYTKTTRIKDNLNRFSYRLYRSKDA